jgi:hypothetical protein
MRLAVRDVFCIVRRRARSIFPETRAGLRVHLTVEGRSDININHDRRLEDSVRRSPLLMETAKA